MARRRGRQECLLRIRTTLEMTKVGACDVMSTESEMGVERIRRKDGERDKDSEGEK